MEYCSGGDLGRIIKKCKRERVNLEESLIWKVFAQIALALKQCHQRSENAVAKPVLHRDIKPANGNSIILPYRILIVDFF